MSGSRVSKSVKRNARKLEKQNKSSPKPIPVLEVPPLEPRNTNQEKYLLALNNYPQIFALGAAGVGKTYLVTHWAVKNIAEGNLKKMIVTRPMVSSDPSERLGFLPGDINMKFTPWALPILDIVEDLIGKVKTDEWLRTGKIEFAPFEFMRGRTFKSDTVVILDEAQNCTISQIRLFVTRLGQCKCVISGDPMQSDIRNSGLVPVLNIAKKHRVQAAFCEFDSKDIVRSRLCQMWVEAFEKEENS